MQNGVENSSTQQCIFVTSSLVFLNSDKLYPVEAAIFKNSSWMELKEQFNYSYNY